MEQLTPRCWAADPTAAVVDRMAWEGTYPAQLLGRGHKKDGAVCCSRILEAEVEADTSSSHEELPVVAKGVRRVQHRSMVEQDRCSSRSAQAGSEGAGREVGSDLEAARAGTTSEPEDEEEHCLAAGT